MKESHKIYGEALPPEDKKLVVKTLEKWNAESRGSLKGELNKTPEQFRFIKDANAWIGREFTELEIEDPPIVAQELIHYLPEEEYKKLGKRQSKTIGVSFSLENTAYVNISACNRLQLFKTTLHEMIHLVSAKAVFVDPKKATISPYRIGYDVEHGKSFFHGLNEAVVDKMTLEILKKNWGELEKSFSVSEEETENNPVTYYHDYMLILETIIDDLSEHTKENPEEIWKDFKMGLLTGELMGLRKIERVYGKGGLRILSLMGQSNDSKEHDAILRKIKRYFSEKDSKNREKIAEKILG